MLNVIEMWFICIRIIINTRCYKVTNGISAFHDELMEILNTIFAMDEFKDALPNLFERSANDNLIALIFSITKATLTTSDSMV